MNKDKKAQRLSKTKIDQQANAGTLPPVNPNQSASGPKVYQTPVIQKFGSIRDLTQSRSRMGTLDGGSKPLNRRMNCITLPPEIEEHRALILDEITQ